VEIKGNSRFREALPTPTLPHPLAVEDLAVTADRLGGWVKVRVVDIAGPIVTRELVLSLPVERGTVIAEPRSDVLKAVVVDRRGSGRRTVGFVKGFGLRRGAVASSLSYDVSNLVAVGVEDAEIAFALNRLVEIGGGFVIAASGSVVEELPLPVGGIVSEEPIPILAERMARLKQVLKEFGAAPADPLLTLQALTFTAIPAMRLRERGLLQVKTRQLVPLLVESAGTAGGRIT
jgi:adenine deaminase